VLLWECNERLLVVQFMKKREVNDPKRLRRNATEKRSRRNFDSDLSRNSIKWELESYYEKDTFPNSRCLWESSANVKIACSRTSRDWMIDSRPREK